MKYKGVLLLFVFFTACVYKKQGAEDGGFTLRDGKIKAGRLSDSPKVMMKATPRMIPRDTTNQ